MMNDYKNIAILGAGVIGASWASLFLASGRNVAIYDASPDAEQKVRAYIDMAWPSLQEIGLVNDNETGALSFYDNPADAVADADFVQESVPEVITIKHSLYQQIEPALKQGAIVSSSASGLTLTEMQEGWKNPSHFILGHPFNPPHLIPLVEVMGNDKTAAGVVAQAELLYQAIGKVTILVQREVPGHIANRLQAALWREAVHLVQTGVGTVEDVDKAIWAGPGLRWAAMGPTMLFHLGAGEGGLPAFCNNYTASFNRWWADLGQPMLDGSVSDLLAEGVIAEAQNATVAELSSKRDAMIVAMQKATRELRG